MGSRPIQKNIMKINKFMTAEQAVALIADNDTVALIGAGRPGLFTHVGLGTFVDPRFDGGRMNKSAGAPLAELVTIDGKELLRYKPFPINVAIIRGSMADAHGNVSLDQEPANVDTYAA